MNVDFYNYSLETQKPILIHTHFHRRRTGVTRSIENVLPYFNKNFSTYVYGYGVEGDIISFNQILKLVFSKTDFVMHCHRNNEIIRALFFRLLGGKFKLISTRHAETTPSSFTQFLHKKTDVVVTLTKSMATSLPFMTTIIGHGVDINEFKPSGNSKLPFISQKNIISCAGRIRDKKGQKILLEALIPLLKEDENWALIIVGKSDKEEFLFALKAMVKKNNISDQVYFLEETREIVTIYQASNTVIVPSFTEGFSLVCAEAMACGCNVIATENIGEHSKLISHKKNGYLFEAGNIEQLRSIVNEIMNQDHIGLGSQARKKIVENWSSEKEANKLMEIYV